MVRKFQMASRDLTIRINPPNVQPDFHNTLRFLRAAFQEMLRELTGHLPAGDMVRLTLRHPLLDNEIWLPFLFNREENQKYVGAMPDVKYYDPDGLCEKERSES
jgi:hypothetical protein